MTTNRVPATSSGQRPHVLDGTCWCKPTATTDRGSSTLQHYAHRPSPVPHTGQRVRLPRWMRPWGKR